jgi:peptide/nickel transport system permease protein
MSATAGATSAVYSKSPARAAISALFRSRGVRIPVLIIAAIAILRLAAPLIAPHDPLKQDAFAALAGPSGDHLLGTDSLGRDVLSRLIYGGGLTLSIGFVSSLLAMLFGTVVGVAAGYLGRRVDYTLMRGVDSFLAFPAMLLALSILAAIGPGFMNLSLAISTVYFASFALLSRLLTLRERELEYVAASIAAGGTKWFVLRRHLLPNIFPGILAHMSLVLPLAVLTEAALSFLGFTASPSAPSWGRMIREGAQFLFAPHVVLAPMIALSILVFSLQVLARSVQRAIDPSLESTAAISGENLRGGA